MKAFSNCALLLLLVMLWVLLWAGSCLAQDSPTTSQELARVSKELRETRAELSDSRRQIDELRRGLEELRSQVQGGASAETALSPLPDAAEPTAAEPTVSKADQDPSFLAAKVAELHQVKVESASRYPLKLSGLVLFNAYSNSGSVDIADLPSLTFPSAPNSSGGDIGATLRQTMLGLEISGPKLFGAQSSADVSLDFAGGSPTTSYGITAGLVRLRTANFQLAWEHTTLNIGQDKLFFSPLSPTSYATVLEPALAWSGNLWVWTPQIEVERRFDLNSGSQIILQGGLLDPLTEQIPPFQGREAGWGELSRTPAIAGRIALDRSSAARYPFSIGFGGYRARFRIGDFKEQDSWTLNSDFKIPLGKYVEASGEWYQGQAAGGLGGGIWTSVIYPDPSAPHSDVLPLRSTGGWAQLKIKPATHFEINGAAGQDENYGEDLRAFPDPYTASGYGALKKNRTELVNLIYKPNSVLLFAIEYRHLFTAPATGPSATAEHVNVSAGVRF